MPDATKPKPRSRRQLFTFATLRGSGDAEVARLADCQHGCVHRMQLAGAGIGRHALAWRLRNSRLSRVTPNVFLVGSSNPARFTREMAMILECRARAVLGGRSAAYLWGLTDARPPVVTVTAADKLTKRIDGLRVHCSSLLTRDQVRWHSGIPVASPALTLIELAATLDPYELENALAQALRRGIMRRKQLAEAIARAVPNTKGIAVLRQLLESEASPSDTRSRYERKLLKLIRDAGLPEPRANVDSDGHLVDLHWPAQGLVVEFDSWEFHGDRRSFERDRRRDQDHASAGIRTLRITARQVDHEPLRLVAVLTTAIRAYPQDVPAARDVLAAHTADRK